MWCVSATVAYLSRALRYRIWGLDTAVGQSGRVPNPNVEDERWWEIKSPGHICRKSELTVVVVAITAIVPSLPWLPPCLIDDLSRPIPGSNEIS